MHSNRIVEQNSNEIESVDDPIASRKMFLCNLLSLIVVFLNIESLILKMTKCLRFNFEVDMLNFIPAVARKGKLNFTKD